MQSKLGAGMVAPEYASPVILVDPVSGAPSGGGFRASADFTPAAAAYGAGDIMEGAKAFAFGPSQGGPVIITGTRLLIAHTAIISGETSYALALYNVTPPSALADNAVWDLPSGDRASFLGRVELGTPVDLGASLYVETNGLQKQIIIPSGGNIYGYLITDGAFTATAAARSVTLLGLGG